MPINTALKRSSATEVLLSSRGWVFPGVAGVSQAERQAATFMYSGILAAVGAIIGPIRAFTAEHIDTHFIAEDIDTHFITNPIGTHFIAESS